jgi:integrase
MKTQINAGYSPTMNAPGAGAAPGERAEIDGDESEYTPGYFRAVQDQRMTFGLFIEAKFLPDHVGHKTQAGQQFYRSILKHLITPERINEVEGIREVVKPRLARLPNWPYLDDIRLCEFSGDHVRKIISAAISRKYSPETVRHIRNLMSVVISHASREGCFLGPNPVSSIKLPRLKPKQERLISRRGLHEVLNLMRYPERQVAMMAITTDLNIVEICNLQWKHVNFSDTPRYVDGEAIPAQSIVVCAPWNKEGVGDTHRGRARTVRLSSQLLSMLNELKQGEYSASENFVLNSSRGKRLQPASIRVARLKPIGREVGMPWLSWSDLRRARMLLLSELEFEPREERIPIAWESGPIAAPGTGSEGMRAESKATVGQGRHRVRCPLCCGDFECRG